MVELEVVGEVDEVELLVRAAFTKTCMPNFSRR
jgi:hypothetical protein